MASDSEVQLLTVEEVSHLLRIKPATVYEAAASGRIPCVKLWRGRRKALVRFRLSDIQEFIARRSVPVKGAEHGGEQGR
jgi:excisionase family DNA binding protein